MILRNMETIPPEPLEPTEATSDFERLKKCFTAPVPKNTLSRLIQDIPQLPQ